MTTSDNKFNKSLSLDDFADCFDRAIPIRKNCKALKPWTPSDDKKLMQQQKKPQVSTKSTKFKTDYVAENVQTNLKKEGTPLNKIIKANSQPKFISLESNTTQSVPSVDKSDSYLNRSKNNFTVEINQKVGISSSPKSGTEMKRHKRVRFEPKRSLTLETIPEESENEVEDHHEQTRMSDCNSKWMNSPDISISLEKHGKKENNPVLQFLKEDTSILEPKTISKKLDKSTKVENKERNIVPLDEIATTNLPSNNAKYPTIVEKNEPKTLKKSDKSTEIEIKERKIVPLDEIATTNLPSNNAKYPTIVEKNEPKTLKKSDKSTEIEIKERKIVPLDEIATTNLPSNNAKYPTIVETNFDEINLSDNSQETMVEAKLSANCISDCANYKNQPEIRVVTNRAKDSKKKNKKKGAKKRKRKNLKKRKNYQVTSSNSSLDHIDSQDPMQDRALHTSFLEEAYMPLINSHEIPKDKYKSSYSQTMLSASLQSPIRRLVTFALVEVRLLWDYMKTHFYKTEISSTV